MGNRLDSKKRETRRERKRSRGRKRKHRERREGDDGWRAGYCPWLVREERKGDGGRGKEKLRREGDSCRERGREVGGLWRVMCVAWGVYGRRENAEEEKRERNCGTKRRWGGRRRGRDGGARLLDTAVRCWTGEREHQGEGERKRERERGGAWEREDGKEIELLRVPTLQRNREMKEERKRKKRKEERSAKDEGETRERI